MYQSRTSIDKYKYCCSICDTPCISLCSSCNKSVCCDNDCSFTYNNINIFNKIVTTHVCLDCMINIKSKIKLQQNKFDPTAQSKN